MSKTDYDLRKIRAFAFDVDGVLSPSTIPLGPDGTPQRMVNIKDGYALQLAARLGYPIAIITGADTPNIVTRFSALGIKDIYLKAAMKAPILKEWMERNGLSADQVAFAGDDIPDYEPMRMVGLSICPVDGSDDIKSIARYICPVAGGYGVARDIIEQVLKVNNQWMNNDKAFGW